MKKTRLDNIALVPASLLTLKDSTYQPIANTLPTGSVLCAPKTTRQQKILAKVALFFRSHGHSVITLPVERITKKIQKAPRPITKTIQIAF